MCSLPADSLHFSEELVMDYFFQQTPSYLSVCYVQEINKPHIQQIILFFFVFEK